MSTKMHNKLASENEQTRKRAEKKSEHQDQTFRPHSTDALQRMANASRTAVRPADILALQSSVGNQAVQRLIDRVPTRGAAPTVIQTHIPDDLQGIMWENNDKLRVETAEIKEAHTAAIEGGGEVVEANELVASNVRSASGAYKRLNTAANALLGAVNQAIDEPCEETEGG
jgi:chemotaxis response regulator CheB